VPKILVINDQPDLVEVCGLVLEAEGFEVETEVQSHRAFEHARLCRPDLIVLDMVMPVVNGAAVLCQLRGDLTTASIPILMMSALERGPDLARALGAEAFLAKPFDAGRLIEAVNDTLGSTHDGWKSFPAPPR
jgi:CheY-like chemotaxis protein